LSRRSDSDAKVLKEKAAVPDLSGHWDSGADDFWIDVIQTGATITGKVTFESSCDEENSPAPPPADLNGTVNADGSLRFLAAGKVYEGKFALTPWDSGEISGTVTEAEPKNGGAKQEIRDWYVKRPAKNTTILARGSYSGETEHTVEIKANVSQLKEPELAYFKTVARVFFSVWMPGSYIYQSPPLDPPSEFVTSEDLLKLLADSQFKAWAGDDLTSLLGEFDKARSALDHWKQSLEGLSLQERQAK
jgi:hypothetical protein